MRRDAGDPFIAAVEPLLPVHEEREPWFERCVELCDLYLAATEAQRRWLRSRIDRASSGKLGLFGLRAAVLAARDHSPSLARTAVTAFVIVDVTGHDIRDVLIGLSLLCHCAALSGADVSALLRDVGAMGGPALGTLYREWADQYPEIQGIGAMGWRQLDTADGIGFRH
ncbi:MAG TPA: hypothetical protein VG456_25875 [Candidatus Sulfopaludibacter sp.]|jgi:hypothetical protein|nr:hypothetical protein [Candidatus Sulfopaludibacter sp.]